MYACRSPARTARSELRKASSTTRRFRTAFTFDAWGNFWLAEAGQSNIRVFSPQCKELVQVDSGGCETTNLTIGGPNYDVLYVTGGGVLRRVDVNVPGFPGHPGADSYAALKELPYTVNVQ